MPACPNVDGGVVLSGHTDVVPVDGQTWDTDPWTVVEKDGKQELVDVAELYDIASPLKVSSNGYSYDGPPYNAGSSDILGKIAIEEDGIYRFKDAADDYLFFAIDEDMDGEFEDVSLFQF